MGSATNMQQVEKWKEIPPYSIRQSGYETPPATDCSLRLTEYERLYTEEKQYVV